MCWISKTISPFWYSAHMYRTTRWAGRWGGPTTSRYSTQLASCWWTSPPGPIRRTCSTSQSGTCSTAKSTGAVTWACMNLLTVCHGIRSEGELPTNMHNNQYYPCIIVSFNPNANPNTKNGCVRTWPAGQMGRQPCCWPSRDQVYTFGQLSSHICVLKKILAVKC